jgi:hypothetical protein
MPYTSWFMIDNAGKLFPIVTEAYRSSYFRMAVTLKDSIDPVILQQAALQTLTRFPNFNTRLKRGLFWNYLETQNLPFKVKPDPNLFGSQSNPYDHRKHLVEIYFHRHRIAIEVFHAITDGRGGIEFLKTLTLAYLKLKQLPVESEGLIMDPLDQVTESELEDSFAKKILPGKSEFLPTKKAYHLRGTYFQHVGHYLTHLEFSSQEFLALAREKKTTITAVIASVLTYMLIAKQKEDRPKVKRPIILSIPVDMRKYFPSTTMKNFVMTINIGKIYPDDSSFDDILSYIHRQLIDGQTAEKLAPQIRANMKAETMLLLRFVPLFIKNLIVRYVFNRVGEPALTFTMSNLGKVTMPVSTIPYIDHFEFMICSTHVMPINLGIVSFEDKLILTFSRIIEDRTLIQQCVDYFKKELNLTMMVSSNRWDEQA